MLRCLTRRGTARSRSACFVSLRLLQKGAHPRQFSLQRCQPRVVPIAAPPGGRRQLAGGDTVTLLLDLPGRAVVHMPSVPNLRDRRLL
jgi:hypothetical protein